MSIKQHGEGAVPTITAAMGILIYFPCRLLEEASVRERAEPFHKSYGADRNIPFFRRRKLGPTVSKLHVKAA